MTTCIAAACQHDGLPKTILCTDLKISSTIWSSETEFKLYDLSPSPFIGMFAGDPSQARELLAMYKAHLANVKFRPDEIQNELRKPIERMKEQMIEHHIRRRLGISYEAYLAKLDKLGASALWTKVSNELDLLNIDVELIIAGFNPAGGESPHLIFRVILEDVQQHQHFACIGAGLVTAEQLLHRRKQEDLLHIAHTMYNVYEAKKESESAPSVGKDTFLIELYPPTGKEKRPGGRLYSLDVLNFLERCRTKYGLKEVAGVEFPENMTIYVPGTE